MRLFTSLGALLPAVPFLASCASQTQPAPETKNKSEATEQTKQALTIDCQVIWTAENPGFCDAIGEVECSATCRDGSEPFYGGYGDGGCRCDCCDIIDDTPIGCGDGTCDRWNGEDHWNCPSDCTGGLYC